MPEAEDRTWEEEAKRLAADCLAAMHAHQTSEHIRFIEVLLADLSEVRDDLLHQASQHHPHHEL